MKNNGNKTIGILKKENIINIKEKLTQLTNKKITEIKSPIRENIRMLRGAYITKVKFQQHSSLKMENEK